MAWLAVRLGVPVVDIGGGLGPAPDEQVYARTIAGALGAVGFEGRLLAEPGRAIVGEAVELACTVRAVKRLSDGTRCVVVDAGTDLLPGAHWRWPHVDAPYATGPSAGPALIAGALCSHLEILHPRVELPAIAEGEVLLIRRVGAYNQSQSTQSGDLRPAVIARDRGEWRPCERRETIEDLIADRPRRATRAHDHSTNGLRPDPRRLCTPTATAHCYSTRSDRSPSQCDRCVRARGLEGRQE